MTGKAFQRLCGVIFVLTSAYKSSSYQEDTEIQILPDQAEELYSSILRSEATQMLYVLTLRSNSRQLYRRRNMNLTKPQGQANYC
ncbi:hypothetical protein DPMN_110018 [Dreissena polymorpha]|uniref:Uncharacterized protein n=1 Tax=Dreissena polymorpha TaxID=45954 RepID=A0A9D4KBA8_DREPO|nr:hypothetical protein DPMN_110018 [Dreissena polymorpha]